MPGITMDTWIDNPLNVVSTSLESNGAAGYTDHVTQYFQKAIEDLPNGLRSIPSLNCFPTQDLRPDSLVRFRCMIQDMFGPEYYLDVFETRNASCGEKKIHSGRYRDVTSTANGTEIVHDSPVNRTSERHIYYCVPIPGENEWVKLGYKSTSLSPADIPQASTSQSYNKSKRSLDEDDMETDAAPEQKPIDIGHCSIESSLNSDQSKRSKNSPSSKENDSTANTSSPRDMNFPLPGELGPAAIVKVYDDLCDSLKLNETIEVIGVVSLDPSLSFIGGDDEMLGVEEAKAHHPPASVIPRIHAVHIKKLKYANPLLPNTTDINQVKLEVQTEAKDIRDNLVAILEHSLCGDSLAAEFLLCHLVSSVYIRKETIAVGKLPVNLTKVPIDGQIAGAVTELISKLVTTSYYLPLSLDNMNKMSFIPTKDYDANRLKSGILQLPDRCHLVLDETALQPGQLDVNGVKNLTALGNLIRWQRVGYDFKYHSQEFTADVPVLTLSEGKSLLPSDIVVPLIMNTEIPLEARQSAINSYLTNDLLDKIRLYLTLIPTLDYQMSEQMTQMVQEDFVSTRQANKDSMSVDDFQLLLVLARLMSISNGSTDLTTDIWNKTKQMEEERKHRLSL